MKIGYVLQWCFVALVRFVRMGLNRSSSGQDRVEIRGLRRLFYSISGKLFQSPVTQARYDALV